MSEEKKQLPQVKVKLGDKVYSGQHDAEKGIVILEDGRVIRVPNVAQTAPINAYSTNTVNESNSQVAPGIQKPQTDLERMEAKKREMEEREAQKKEELAQKNPNITGDKKREIERKKQEAIEQRNIQNIEKANKKRLEKERKIAAEISKREASKNAKISGDAGNYNSGKNQLKKTFLAIGYILVIVGLMAGAKMFLDSQQEEITVVRLKNDMIAGEVINENNIEPYKMLKKSYDELGTVSYTTANGASSIKQIIYRWENKNDVVGKYIAIYTQGGQYLTLKNVTDKKIIRNPWLADVGATQEIYTLPISTEGINTRLLLPGSHLRVRVVIQQKGTVQGSDPFGGDPFNEDPFATSEPPVSSPIIGENELDKNAILAAGGTVPLGTVVFDDLTAVDMLNAKGESLFDVYMALSKLPVEERSKYLETTIQGDSNAFQQKVLPASLVLVLTKPQATAMAEFENMTGAVIKYTILPYKDDSGNLLSSFTEIADQMSDIIQENQQVSPTGVSN